MVVLVSTRGRKQRSWRTLRCVVEVKVPPSNRSDEKDLVYQVEYALDRIFADIGMPLPRVIHADHNRVTPRVKAWTPVFRYVVNHLPEPIRRRITMSY